MRAIVFLTTGGSVDGVLRTALLSRRWEILCATCEGELIALVRETAPTLVIISSAGEGPSLDAARRLRDSDRHVPIVLSAPACSSDLAIGAAAASLLGVS